MTCKDHSPCIQARMEEIEMNHEWERTEANAGQDNNVDVKHGPCEAVLELDNNWISIVLYYMSEIRL